MGNTKTDLSKRDANRIIEMAWEDRTPFEAIEFQFGLIEAEVITAFAEFLVSDRSSWIAGQIMHIDGGMSSIKK